jgi:predicted outer membrane repeat protein
MNLRDTLVMLALALSGCERGPDPLPQEETDADADADTDTDTDTDTDLPADLDGDGYPAEEDCDDNDEAVFPGAPEHCGDGRITDCDRTSEDGLASTSRASQVLRRNPQRRSLSMPLEPWISARGEGPESCWPQASGRRAGGAKAGITGRASQVLRRNPQRPSLSRSLGPWISASGWRAKAGYTDTTYTSTELQDVLDLAEPGATVHVCAGTWTGNFVADEPVNLVGHGGAELVQLVAAQKDSVLALVGDSTLSGVTLTGGEADDGGGLRVTGPGTLVVTDCVIRDNKASYGGGGVSLGEGLQASFPGTLITGNRVSQDGGGLEAWRSTVDLTGAVVEGNESFNNGAGVSLFEATLIGGTIRDNEVLGTSVFNGGGGVVAFASDLVDVIIEGNRSGGNGGGLYAEGTVTVRGGSITDNRTVGPYWTSGGGIATDWANLTLEGTAILRNSAEWGGGIATSDTLRSIDCDWGEGVDDNSPSDVYHYDDGSFSAPPTFTCDEQGCDL